MKPETNWMRFINVEIIYKQRSKREIVKFVHFGERISNKHRDSVFMYCAVPKIYFNVI